jgi:hypothetical protein
MEMEIKVIPEKAQGGSDAKPEAPAIEGVSRGERGPRFADLGGMEAVIEQLMMELVVPCSILSCHGVLGLGLLLGCCCTDRLAVERPPLHMPLPMRLVCHSTRSRPLKSSLGYLVYFLSRCITNMGKILIFVWTKKF